MSRNADDDLLAVALYFDRLLRFLPRCLPAPVYAAGATDFNNVLNGFWGVVVDSPPDFFVVDARRTEQPQIRRSRAGWHARMIRRRADARCVSPLSPLTLWQKSLAQNAAMRQGVRDLSKLHALAPGQPPGHASITGNPPARS